MSAPGKAGAIQPVPRREFITLLGGTAIAWPLAARAQQPAMPVIGFLNGGTPNTSASLILLAAFREGLKEFGYVEGQNTSIIYRWAEGQYDRLPGLAADLVRRQVSVLVAGAGADLIAKAATATIPIVASSGGDPVKSGLVASLNRPDGNITGVALFAYSLGPKRLELLRELVPNAKVIGVLVNPNNPLAEDDRKSVEVAARVAGQPIYFLQVSGESDLNGAFAALVQRRASALLVMADPFLNNIREKIIALAAWSSIPAIYEWRESAAAGGLMSYGSSVTDAYRQVGHYTAKILKGANPAELPVVQAVKVELVINLKTAKTLGITFPITLLGRADEAIE